MKTWCCTLSWTPNEDWMMLVFFGCTMSFFFLNMARIWADLANVDSSSWRASASPLRRSSLRFMSRTCLKWIQLDTTMFLDVFGQQWFNNVNDCNESSSFGLVKSPFDEFRLHQTPALSAWLDMAWTMPRIPASGAGGIHRGLSNLLENICEWGTCDAGRRSHVASDITSVIVHIIYIKYLLN